MHEPVTVVVKHRRKIGLGVLLLGVLLVVGVLGHEFWTHHRQLIGRGLVCAYHGARAWIDARHHHPFWSSLQLFKATHDCKPAPWRY
jgi:hypothetical protein